MVSEPEHPERPRWDKRNQPSNIDYWIVLGPIGLLLLVVLLAYLVDQLP